MTNNTVETIPQATKLERDQHFARENEMNLIAVLEAESLDDDGQLTETGESVIALALALLAQVAHGNARAKGWYEADRGFPEEVALMHSELSEALEEYRGDRGFGEHYYSQTIDGGATLFFDSTAYHEPGQVKPEGIAAELGDVVIRIADAAGNPDRPIDLARGVLEKIRYNRTRPARHGNKKA